MDTMKIVITGSLGHIGRPLTEGLLKEGHSPLVVSSKPDRVKEIEDLGAKAAVGSLEDVRFLTETFRGSDIVYCMVPPSFTEPDQLAYYVRVAEKYAEAIRASGVRRVIYLSSYGADLESGTGFIVGSHRSEQILNRLTDVSVTHMRPGYFYYNLLGFTGMIQHQGVMGANYGGEDRLVMVDPADIAEAIVKETGEPATHRKVVYVASDDRTASEIAAVLGRAIGKPDLQWLTFTSEQMQTGLEAHMPAATAAKLVELGMAIHTGRLRKDYDLHPPVPGRRKLEGFAPVFAQAFKK